MNYEGPTTDPAFEREGWTARIEDQCRAALTDGCGIVYENMSGKTVTAGTDDVIDELKCLRDIDQDIARFVADEDDSALMFRRNLQIAIERVARYIAEDCRQILEIEE